MYLPYDTGPSAYNSQFSAKIMHKYFSLNCEQAPSISSYKALLSAYAARIYVNGSTIRWVHVLLVICRCDEIGFRSEYRYTYAHSYSHTHTKQSDMFQDDIYPPTFSGEAAQSAEDWLSGQNKDPLLMAFSADGLKELGPKESQVVSTCTLLSNH